MQGYEWPKDVELTVETLKPKTPGNAGIQWVAESASGESTPAEPAARVRVSNASDSTSEQLVVGWAGGASGALAGKPVNVYVPPGQSRVISVPVPAGVAGLDRVINTRQLILIEKAQNTYYLRLFDGWMTASSLDGPWEVASKPPKELDQAMATRGIAVFDIDVQGGNAIKRKFPDAILVYVLPPSWEELDRRLRSRGTDADDVIRRRLLTARAETQKGVETYDYLVINDRLDDAFQQLRSIVVAERTRRGRVDLAGLKLSSS